MLRRPITSQALLRAMQSAQKCESSAIVTSGRLREKQEIKVVGARSWDVIPNPENYEHFIEKSKSRGRAKRSLSFRHSCALVPLVLLEAYELLSKIR